MIDVRVAIIVSVLCLLLGAYTVMFSMADMTKGHVIQFNCTLIKQNPLTLNKLYDCDKVRLACNGSTCGASDNE